MRDWLARDLPAHDLPAHNLPARCCATADATSCAATAPRRRVASQHRCLLVHSPRYTPIKLGGHVPVRAGSLSPLPRGDNGVRTHVPRFAKPNEVGGPRSQLTDSPQTDLKFSILINKEKIWAPRGD